MCNGRETPELHKLAKSTLNFFINLPVGLRKKNNCMKKNKLNLLKIISLTIIIAFVSCKKEKTVDPKKPIDVYWGDLTYIGGRVIRDSSTYQLFPAIETNSDCIDLKPRVNNLQSASETSVGSKCDFRDEYKPYSPDICYLYKITTPMTGTFTSTRTMKIDPVVWNGIKLTKGSIRLNNDNSIDVEYTDSVCLPPLSAKIRMNHYKIHYIGNY